MISFAIYCFLDRLRAGENCSYIYTNKLSYALLLWLKALHVHVSYAVWWWEIARKNCLLMLLNNLLLWKVMLALTSKSIEEFQYQTFSIWLGQSIYKKDNLNAPARLCQSNMYTFISSEQLSLKVSCRTLALRKNLCWQTGELQCHP